jgi:hypothetical protein
LKEEHVSKVHRIPTNPSVSPWIVMSLVEGVLVLAGYLVCKWLWLGKRTLTS